MSGVDRRILFFCISLIIFIEIFFVFFPDRLPIPQETHFFISLLTQMQSGHDPSSLFYSLLVTPAYHAVNGIFQNPYLFILLSYFAHFTFSIYIFALVFFIVKKPIPAFLLWCVFSPLFSTLSLKLFGLNLIPNPKAAFEWGNVTFTVRLLFGFVYAALVYCYSTERFKLAFYLSAIAFLMHPNSAIFSLVILMSCEIILLIQSRIDFRRFLGLLVIGSICLLMVLFKVNSIDYPGIGDLDGLVRYQNLIRDESDDFSIYAYFVYAKSQLLIYLVFYLTTILAYQKLCAKKLMQDPLFLISFVPCLFFILGLFYELILIKFPIDFFVELLLGLQPGHKLLAFSFFPLLFIWARILSKFTNSQRLLPNYFLWVSIFLGFLMTTQIITNNKNIQFLKKVKSIQAGPNSYAEALVLRSKMIDQLNPSLPKIYLINENENFGYDGEFDLRRIKAIESSQADRKLDEVFSKKYNTIFAFEEFLDLITENVPIGSSIIIPPYMFNVRDSLYGYNIFFQEHHDGNVMMGSPQASAFFLERMRALLGEIYSTFPTQESGLNYSYMRAK
ncbi:hypothetical protein, partial [Shewanella sp.]|uniref:hypothetical protein n=1 Tax=Shewanella sp. TaxID=50422 RepID=UPI00404732FD